MTTNYKRTRDDTRKSDLFTYMKMGKFLRAVNLETKLNDLYKLVGSKPALLRGGLSLQECERLIGIHTSPDTLMSVKRYGQNTYLSC